jgi:ankyrin repeat protein
MLAAQQEDLACVQELLKFNADVNTKDQDGDTALKYALYNGSEAKACARELARVIKENKQREAAGTKPA